MKRDRDRISAREGENGALQQIENERAFLPARNCAVFVPRAGRQLEDASYRIRVTLNDSVAITGPVVMVPLAVPAARSIEPE